MAPSRKVDPGEKFDWRRLAGEGVGLWVPPVPADPNDAGLDIGAEGEEIAEAQRLLQRFGYGIEPTGFFEEAMRPVVRAFQLHFRQERPDFVFEEAALFGRGLVSMGANTRREDCENR